MPSVDRRLTRRSLAFRELDDAVRDAEALLAGGYASAGRWSLAQCCGHLADWLRYPVEGFPRQPPHVRLLLRLLKATAGGKMLRGYLATGQMPAGGPTMPETVPPPGGDDAAAVEAFREAVGRFQAHVGPYHPSPLYGPLDRETATRLQRIHCAHHLSFLIPRSPATPGGTG